jgi:hypothetical protein
MLLSTLSHTRQATLTDSGRISEPINFAGFNVAGREGNSECHWLPFDDDSWARRPLCTGQGVFGTSERLPSSAVHRRFELARYHRGNGLLEPLLPDDLVTWLREELQAVPLVTEVHFAMDVEVRRIAVGAAGGVQVDQDAFLDEQIDAARAATAVSSEHPALFRERDAPPHVRVALAVNRLALAARGILHAADALMTHDGSAQQAEGRICHDRVALAALDTRDVIDQGIEAPR